MAQESQRNIDKTLGFATLSIESFITNRTY
jgi:hypothetical protein